jgi:enoyl-CoA hydratase/carnithine racemase
MAKSEELADMRSVRLTENGNVSLVSLCDRAPGNRMSPALVRELIDALGRARGSAIVLAAEGKNFCTGGDHHAIEGLSALEVRSYLDDLTTLFTGLATGPVPLVAAVQGAVIGGGVELVLPADFIIASEDATFHLPQVALGIRIGDYSHRAILARCDLSFVRRMVLAGDRVPAIEAAEHGLVDRIVPQEDLLVVADALANQLANQPEKALRRARASIAEWSGQSGR